MSPGLWSLWRTRSRCAGVLGAAVAWTAVWGPRAPLPPFSTLRRHDATRFPATSWTQAPAASWTQGDTAETESPKRVRNRRMRAAFRDESPDIERAIDHKLDSPFVPVPREYPFPMATRKYLAVCRRIARVQVGFDIVAEQQRFRMPDWDDMFKLLKRMTPKRSEVPQMAAIRIVLPQEVDLDTLAKSNKVEFLDSVTGLPAKLRLSSDPGNSRAIVLRGQNSTLGKVADDVVAACGGRVEVFKLGEVGALDYESKRLWPVIADAPSGGESLSADKLETVFVHKEPPTYWIDTPYEPPSNTEQWDKEAFANYITSLVCGRLRPHLATEYYGKPEKDGSLIDTDGIRARFILEAFQESVVKRCVTPLVLKMALNFLAQRGGHRAAAERLLGQAEGWGVPVDTDMFNIMLAGYVAKRDAYFFHNSLLNMEAGFLAPNAYTWLLFLNLVKRDGERRQIVEAMDEVGLVESPAARRGMAAAMASHDAYVALKDGKTLKEFLKDQEARYGAGWLSVKAKTLVLKEFFRFHHSSDPNFRDFEALADMQPDDGPRADISTVNAVFEFSAMVRDWRTAQWALNWLDEHGGELNHRSYTQLVALAARTRSPSALSVIFVYGTLGRMLRQAARFIMLEVLLGSHAEPFWADVRPKVLSADMARRLEASKVGPGSSALAAAEWAILSEAHGRLPRLPLAVAIDVARRTRDRPLHRGTARGAPVPDFFVELLDSSGMRARRTIVFDSSFDPNTMMVPDARPDGPEPADDAPW